ADPRRLDPLAQPCDAGGARRRRRGDDPAGGDLQARRPSADQERPRKLRQGLEEHRPVDPLMADAAIAEAVKAALAGVEIPGGGTLADYSGLSDIIVTKGAVAFAIAVQPGMEAAFGPAREAAQVAATGAAEGRKVMASITSDRPAATGQAAAQRR